MSWLETQALKIPRDTQLGEQRKGNSLASREPGCGSLPFAYSHRMTPARPQPAICPLYFILFPQGRVSGKARIHNYCVRNSAFLCNTHCVSLKQTLEGTRGPKSPPVDRHRTVRLVKAGPAWVCQQFQVRYQFVNLRENQPFLLPETTL